MQIVVSCDILFHSFWVEKCLYLSNGNIDLHLSITLQIVDGDALQLSGPSLKVCFYLSSPEASCGLMLHPQRQYAIMP